ncbi:Chitinase A1 precursor [compost metagenome]
MPTVTPTPTATATSTPTPTVAPTPTATIAPTPTPNPGVSAWAAGVAYKAGDKVSYNGLTYTCLQPHTSLLGWEPTATPALWKLN